MLGGPVLPRHAFDDKCYLGHADGDQCYLAPAYGVKYFLKHIEGQYYLGYADGWQCFLRCVYGDHICAQHHNFAQCDLKLVSGHHCHLDHVEYDQSHMDHTNGTQCHLAMLNVTSVAQTTLMPTSAAWDSMLTGAWGIGMPCTKYSACCYNAVNFVTNIHKRQLIARL